MIERDTLQGYNVLVIDDDLFSLEVARAILKHYGATVHTAKNGLDGLNAVRTVKPHFIICDLSMPVMDGWTMVGQLKQDQALMDIPIIALTAHAMAGDRDRALAAGFQNYLTKPLTPATFMRDLLVLLGNFPDLSSQSES